MNITGLYADGIYILVILFGMFAHYMKGRVKNENGQSVWKYLTENFWTTTFPAISAGIIAFYGMAGLAPEVYYPVTRFAVITIFTIGYTSDSLLNGEIKKKVE